MPSARPLIVSRIRDAIPSFQTVRGTVNVQAVLRQGWAPPACFVWRMARQRISEPGRVRQFETRYGVLIVLKIDNDDGSVDDTAEGLSDGIASLLDDWAPHGRAALVYEGGEALTDLERNLLFWKDIYSLKEFL